nr:myb/SANT-like domain-containing protein [Ipomoea batatas]
MSRLPIVLRRRRQFRMITIMCAMAMAMLELITLCCNSVFIFHRMETDESLSFEHSRGRGKNKCFWTDEESKALIDSLQEMSCDPMWKSDDGFRNGYMGELRKRVLVKLPTFSKQIHKEAKGVWDLRFPYLEVSETIYAKDRATGRGALGFEEAIGQMEADLEIDQSMSINLDDLNVEDDPSEAPTSRSQDSELSKKRKKLAAVRGNDAKKMRGSSSIAHDAKVEGLRKELSAAFQGMSTHFVTIASAIADENNREQMREKRTNTVVEQLSPLGLPSLELFNAASILLKDSSALNLFSQLDIEHKRQYIFSLLYPSMHGSASHP